MRWQDGTIHCLKGSNSLVAVTEDSQVIQRMFIDVTESRQLEEQLETLMEESAQMALAYEQRAQEDAQTIETLAAQAETLADATGSGAPSPALTPPPAPTLRPLYTIPVPGV